MDERHNHQPQLPLTESVSRPCGAPGHVTEADPDRGSAAESDLPLLSTEYPDFFPGVRQRRTCRVRRCALCPTCGTSLTGIDAAAAATAGRAAMRKKQRLWITAAGVAVVVIAGVPVGVLAFGRGGAIASDATRRAGTG
jgi:hypothetical protein